MPSLSGAAEFDETVRRFIKRYGENALAEAQRRIRELDREGDADGAATWRRVAAAIAIASADPGSSRVH